MCIILTKIACLQGNAVIRERGGAFMPRMSTSAAAPSWAAPGCRAFPEASWGCLPHSHLSARLCLAFQAGHHSLCAGHSALSRHLSVRWSERKAPLGLIPCCPLDVLAPWHGSFSYYENSTRGKVSTRGPWCISFHPQPGPSAYATGCPPVVSDTQSVHKHTWVP